jgi:hypothetical protein
MNWEQAGRWYQRQTWPQDGSLSVLRYAWQRELAALVRANIEVNFGGYLQFFANFGREYYEYASRAFRAIGARRMAEIIDACQALVDEHLPNSGDSANQRSIVLPGTIVGPSGEIIKGPGSALPDPVVARILDLSYEFMSYADDLGTLAQAYYGPLIDRDRQAELSSE